MGHMNKVSPKVICLPGPQNSIGVLHTFEGVGILDGAIKYNITYRFKLEACISNQ